MEFSITLEQFIELYFYEEAHQQVIREWVARKDEQFIQENKLRLSLGLRIIRHRRY